MNKMKSSVNLLCVLSCMGIAAASNVANEQVLIVSKELESHVSSRDLKKEPKKKENKKKKLDKKSKKSLKKNTGRRLIKLTHPKKL